MLTNKAKKEFQDRVSIDKAKYSRIVRQNILKSKFAKTSQNRKREERDDKQK